MRRLTILVSALALVIALPGGAALADHPPPTFTTGTPDMTALSGGEGAEWEFLRSFKTENPHSDLEFFTQDGLMYVSVGTIGTGPNGGGQTIFRLTNDNGEFDPGFVSNHPSASCISDPASALGLQHDVEAAPKGDVILNTDWGGLEDRSDAQLLIDATDNSGRCHDNGDLGFRAPQGGLEIVDITDIDNPVEIALTSHIGEAHTVNVDPKRPHIAYAVTSDAVGYGSDQTRDNEDADDEPLDLDGWEMVDLSSCMGFPEGTSVEEKRGVDADTGEFLEGEGCRPEVYRFRYPEEWHGHTTISRIYGCHELELYPEDRLSCGSGQAAILFDISGAFDDNGTPNDFTDDTINGDPLPCRVRETTSDGPLRTGAPIIDCVEGEENEAGEPADLTVPGWLDMGAPGVAGIEFLGAAFHMGRGGPYPAFEDIDFNHETEVTDSRRFLLATDERGGGVVPPGASCAVDNAANPNGNGGLHAYATDRLHADVPNPPVDEDGEYQPHGDAYYPYARQPLPDEPPEDLQRDKAIFRAQPRVAAETLCTAHVFQQVPGQNRIFMGWYTQGTQVVDFHERADGALEFNEAGFWIPTDANQWVSHVYKVEENPDGTLTYWGAAADFRIGERGRNALDLYRVTLPPPPDPFVPAPQRACPTDRVPDHGFEDVRGTHEDSIECIGWYGITRGRGDTDGDGREEFAPQMALTRGQTASFVLRLAVEGGIELPTDPADAFGDDDGTFHEDNINAAAELGLVEGRQDGTFGANAPITRGQMTLLVARVQEVIGGPLPAPLEDYFDDDDGTVYEEAANGLAEIRVLEGRQDVGDVDGDGDTEEAVLLPNRLLTRAQMASFLARGLNIHVDYGDAFLGGAEIELDSNETESGGEISGTVDSFKIVDSLTADGCGLSDAAVEVAEDGTFTVEIGSGQSETCDLALTVTTRRPDVEEETQSVTYAFFIEVTGTQSSSRFGPTVV